MSSFDSELNISHNSKIMNTNIENQIDANECNTKLIEEYQFDPIFYRDTYSDIKKLNDKSLLLHYINYGKKEGRLPNNNIKSEIESETNSISNNKLNINNWWNNTPLINILIRTSNRPDYFQKCISSIVNQNYNPIRVIVSYDSNISYNYLQKYKNIDIFKMPLKSRGKYNVNLYLNSLIDKVDDGWIIFLDDDDFLLDDDSIGTLVKHIKNESQIFFWKYSTYNKLIYPKNIRNIKDDDIVTSNFCFHSEYKNISKWIDQKKGNYRFLIDILYRIKFEREFINETLTGSSHEEIRKIEEKKN